MEQSIARHFIFINNPAFLFSVITQTLGFTLNTVGGHLCRGDPSALGGEGSRLMGVMRRGVTAVTRGRPPERH